MPLSFAIIYFLIRLIDERVQRSNADNYANKIIRRYDK